MKRFFCVLLVCASLLLTACMEEYGKVEPDNTVHAGKSFGAFAYTVAFRRTDVSLAAAFDEVLADMIADGTVRLICENHTGRDMVADDPDPEMMPDYGTPSDGALREVKENGQIVIGYQDQHYPLSWRDANGAVSGIDAELAYEAARRLGLEVVFEQVEWDTQDAALASGKIDAIFSGFEFSRKRAQQYALTRPYLVNDITVLTCNDPAPDSLEALAGMRVGVPGDSFMYWEANKTLKEKNLTVYSTPTSAYYRMKEKRVDAILVDSLFAAYALAGHLAK